MPEVIDDLGYSPLQGDAITSVRSAIGKEPGYMLRVARFASFGFSFSNFVVHVHDLPEGIGLDGLLGLSFLKRDRPSEHTSITAIRSKMRWSFSLCASSASTTSH